MTKETIDNIKEINSFEMDDKKYCSTVFMTSEGPSKIVWDENKNEISDSYELRQAEQNAKNLTEKEIIDFKKDLTENIKTETKKENATQNIKNEIIKESSWNFYNSNKTSVNQYNIKITPELYQKLVPESMPKELNENEIPCIEYRKSTKGEEFDQYLITKLNKNNINQAVFQKEIEIDDNLKKEIGLIIANKKNKNVNNKNDLLKLEPEKQKELLAKNGIKAGNIYKFETEYENEKSVSYYEAYVSAKDNKLRLRTYNKNENYKNETHEDQKANADNIKGLDALAILNNDFAVHFLNAKYKQHPDNKEEFVTNNVKVKFTDITKEAKKKEESIRALSEQEKQRKKEELQKKHGELPTNTLLPIEKIPDDIKMFFEKKNINLTPYKYSEKLYNMTKKFNEVDYNFQNISEEDKKLIKPLLDKYKKTDGSESEMKKVFNQFIFDNKNNSIMERYGILYSKTTDKNFKGYEKKHKPLVQSEMEDNLKAIEENKHPLQQKNIIPDYIYNPETNAIYKGNNQLALQRNNLMNNMNAQAYVPMNSFIQQGGNMMGMKPKCMVIANGQNANGQYTYTVLVPCRIRQTRAQKKMAKEQLRRNIFDAKFNYQYGQLPEFNTRLAPIPEKQMPVPNSQNIEVPTAENIQSKDVETQLKYDVANYFYCALTKQEFNPCRDWTKEPAKTEFMNFAMNNPEKMIKHANNIYESMAQQTRNQTNTNVNNNTNTQVNENVNVNTTEKTKSRGRK